MANAVPERIVHPLTVAEELRSQVQSAEDQIGDDEEDGNCVRPERRPLPAFRGNFGLAGVFASMIWLLVICRPFSDASEITSVLECR